MFANDDMDVKIFGKESKNAQEIENKILLEIDEQHNNGNMELAKRLGRELADELLSADSVSQFGCTDEGGDDIDVSFQRRVLFAFCIEVGLEIYAPNPVIASSANREFNRYLETEYSDFYKRVMDMGAFSLYYLSLRTQNRADDAIGEVFAKLCTGEADERFSSLGRSLFACFMGVIDKKIKDMGFVGFTDSEADGSLVRERG